MSTRVNVGCGQSPTAGWLNFDNSPGLLLARLPEGGLRALERLGILREEQASFARCCQANNIAWANAAKHLPLPDDSVDVVYTSHMVEHLDRAEIKRFLGEAHRVLKPDGILRIVFPDIRVHLKQYEVTGDADTFVERTHLALSRSQGMAARLKHLAVGARHHLWMYDGASMVRLLGEIGFRHAEVIPPGETGIADPSPLDLREREEESAYVESMK